MNSIYSESMKQAEAAFNYAKKKNGVFPSTGANTKEKIEAKILQHPYVAAQYAEEIIGGKWPEAEDIILTNGHALFHYVQYVIKGRWKKAEKIIYTNAELLCKYLSALPYTKKKNKRWIEAEDAILKSKNPECCLQYAFFIGERWTEAEHIIATDCMSSMDYIDEFIKGRWRLAENAILKSFPETSCYVFKYMIKFLKARWLRAEHLVLKYDDTYEYATNILLPWFTGEFGIVGD